MSVLELGNTAKNEPAFQEPVQAPSTTFNDVVSASFDSFQRNFNFDAKTFGINDEVQARNEKFEQAYGKSIYEAAGIDDPNFGPSNEMTTDATIAERNAKLDAFIMKQRETDPDHFVNFKTMAELEGVVKEKAIQAGVDEEKIKAGASGFDAAVGGFVGGLGASFVDPINVATLPFGAGASRSILKAMLIEGAINAGVETAAQPFIADWQKELGKEYGFTEMVENVAIAGFFGAGFTGVIKTASKMVGLGRMADKLDEIGEVDGASAAKTLQRQAHLDEGNLSRATDDIDPKVNKRALEEVNAALVEGRAIDPEKIGVTTRDILDIDPKKIKDPTLRAEVKRFQADAEPRARVEPDSPQPVKKTVAEEIFEDPLRAEPISVTRQKEIEALNSSPQARKAQLDEFNERHKSDDSVAFYDTDLERNVTAGELRKMFKEEDDMINAITTCGV